MFSSNFFWIFNLPNRRYFDVTYLFSKIYQTDCDFRHSISWCYLKVLSHNHKKIFSQKKKGENYTQDRNSLMIQKKSSCHTMYQKWYFPHEVIKKHQNTLCDKPWDRELSSQISYIRWWWWLYLLLHCICYDITYIGYSSFIQDTK